MPENTINHHGNRTTEEHCAVQLLILLELALQKFHRALQKVCRCCSKSAGCCRKSESVAENLQVLQKIRTYTPNANMADHLVGAQDESRESEASQALMFCFDNASYENSCFVYDLVGFASLSLRIFEFLNTT